jgi:ABC-type ATPase with predicted acetyltransferase domain
MNTTAAAFCFPDWDRPPRSRLSRRLCVAAIFGIDPSPHTERARLRRAADHAAASLTPLLVHAGVALIAGPSGAGKSSVLRRLAAHSRRCDAPAFIVPPPSELLAERRPALDLLDGSLDADLRLLCACGLAEARLWLRPARLLSEGQRARLSLALTIAAARRAQRPNPLLIADEFASALDRLSAMSLCFSVRRLLAGLRGVRLAAASAHDDVAQWLRPDVTLRLHPTFSIHAGFTISRAESPT